MLRCAERTTPANQGRQNQPKRASSLRLDFDAGSVQRDFRNTPAHCYVVCGVLVGPWAGWVRHVRHVRGGVVASALAAACYCENAGGWGMEAALTNPLGPRRR